MFFSVVVNLYSKKKIILRSIIHDDAGPFTRFSTHAWQNACVNTFRHVMVCGVYFSLSKILTLLKGLGAYT